LWSPCVLAWRWPFCDRHVINKVTRLGLLSRMAERVTFVLIPAAAADLPGAGHHLPGRRHAHRRRRHGRAGRFRHGHGAGRLSFSLLKQALHTTTKLSCFVVFILVGRPRCLA
jgi:TRAP-type mannitol/chloroaromatic compound transport system permease large subunit